MNYKLILSQIKVLRNSVARAVQSGSNVHFQIANGLNNIRDQLVSGQHTEIAASVRAATQKLESSDGQPPYPANSEVALHLCDTLAVIIRECQPDLAPPAAQAHPTVEAAEKPSTRQVFIIHGHDQANLLRLERLLKERYKLVPVILGDTASKGLTLIEKFEAVAESASFSVALMTPDDLVTAGSSSVTQARPNVIFELGWFYGRLGRARVAILMKKGTQIHSDLNGIVRIEFVDKVDECIVEFERELRGAGMLVD